MKIISEIKKLFTKGEKTLLQKQVRVCLIALCLIVIGLVVYFAFIAPAVNSKENYVPPLFEGEALYQDSTIILMTEPRGRKDVLSIEVSNEVGTYKLMAKTPGSADTTFYFEDEPDITINSNNAISLSTSVLIPMTASPKTGVQDRVNDAASAEELRNYGLDPSQSPSRLTVTLVDGEVYTIVIGGKVPTGAGYYAMIDGRVNTVTDKDGNVKSGSVVYAIASSTYSPFVEKGGEYLVSTLIFPYFSTSIYSDVVLTVENKLAGDEYDTVVKLHSWHDGEPLTPGHNFVLDYPKGYLAQEDLLQNNVLSSLEYLSAVEVHAYGADVHDPEVYEKYGLDLDPERLANGTEDCFARITVDVKDTNDVSDFEDGEYMIYVGDVYYNESGAAFRYAYTPYSEAIFTLEETMISYAAWTSAKFVSANMFYDYLTSLDYLELTGQGTDLRFTLSGNQYTYHVDVTKSGDGSEVVMRDGKPAVFDVKPVKYQYGDYSQMKYEGEFENFRKLFYVLITREFAIESVKYDGVISDIASRTITIKTTERDQNQTYYKFDASGNKVTASNGQNEYVEYVGGNIVCYNATRTVTVDGKEMVLKHDKLFYDEEKGKFFEKFEDRNDGIMKPKNPKIDDNGVLSSWTYLNGEIEATYYTKKQDFNVYDILYDYTDASGKTVQRVNSTYCFVVPTVTVYEYKLNADGTSALVGEETTTSDGLYMRVSQVDKLFSDSGRLLDGIEIDKFGVN